MADVQHQGVRCLVLMKRVVYFRVPVKILPVIQSRQLIALRPADQILVFGKLDAAPNAGQDNLVPRIGLGDKVAGPGV